MKALLATLSLISSQAFAAPAVEVEDLSVPGVTAEQPAKVSSQSYEIRSEVQSTIQPISQRHKYLGANKSYYRDFVELRSQRRVGAGFLGGGQLGVGGLLVDLNVEDVDSVLAGFGGGDNHQSFYLGWKRVLMGIAFTPYVTTGVSHWYATHGNNEKKKNQTYLMPSIGLQYAVLAGPKTGFTAQAELVLQMAASDLRPVPTGALGVLYYF
jgi:hypothetical protein